MSGHSKWHNIQARKGKQDAKRGSVFSRYSKLISVAARVGGGDAETNFSLRLAIDKARAVGVPKDNIERAIKSGTGELKGAQIEEALYEGYGPGGAAILIEVLTDNKNRTVSEIKNILSKNGGSMAASGAVKWMFEQAGIIVIGKEALSALSIPREDFELAIIDAGAQDIKDIINVDARVEIKTKVENLQQTLNKVKELSIEPLDSGLQWVAKDKIKLAPGTEEKLNKLFDALSEHDDVQDFYTNALSS